METIAYSNKTVSTILSTLDKYPDATLDTKIKILSSIKCDIQEAMDTLEYIRHKEETEPTIEIKINLEDLF